MFIKVGLWLCSEAMAIRCNVNSGYIHRVLYDVSMFADCEAPEHNNWSPGNSTAQTTLDYTTSSLIVNIIIKYSPARYALGTLQTT